jgi:predicted O-methyltransferase YrrM
MEFLPEEINTYTEKHSEGESEILAKLNRETWSKMVQPRMLSGHIQGRILSMFSHMIQPRRILEVGTFTGYSALCMAEGLTDDGQLITIDVNEEFEEIIQRYLKESKLDNKIELKIGNAIDIIPSLGEEFDLVFIDADKENYCNYYDLVFDQVRQGGYIIADNVLWSGKVVEVNPDAETKALMDYNEKIHKDKRVENVLLPVRDGLMVCRKK